VRETASEMRNPRRLAALVAASLLALAGTLTATTVIPIPDGELYRRADVVVHGVVLSNDTVEGRDGWPETVTFIRPLRVWKGTLPGDLVLRQAGGELSNGRFFRLWGRPEYGVGDEVVVFALARPEGDFQTAEMLLGKFSVARDDSGRLFAVPELAARDHPGVVVHRQPAPSAESDSSTEVPSARFLPGRPITARADADGAPRELAGFLDFLDAGAVGASVLGEMPVGELSPVVHQQPRKGLVPHWGNIGGSLWRYNDGATEGWSFDGTANMTGGGIAEATAALAAWRNDPNSTIGYTASASGASPIHLNAMTSACGWSTCLSGGGVIGCGGPRGGGSNSWRGDNYSTITSGEVWLRCYANFNGFGSTITTSVLIHELGHTLGLGHSDQNASSHDTCRGDEAQAMMRSSAQNRTTLGTDDQDAIRWIYGDGLTSCANLPAPTASAFSPATGPPGGNTTFTLTGANFGAGATVRIGGVAATVLSVNGTSITGRTPAHATGSVDVVVTNPDGKNDTLDAGYFYDFADVPVSHSYHDAVVTIFKNGITTGCGGNNFCPGAPVTRGQMSVFVLRGMQGGAYLPVPASGGILADVSTTTAFARWIEEFYTDGIADACAAGLPPFYCPWNAVSRAEMAVLLLRGLHGASFVPPPATGVFSDVPSSDPLAAWIEQLAEEGITMGCGGSNYCPTRANTRGEMAVFLARAFNLP
jgi:hypothetical protein